ncbi:5-methylcytosine-specific restriction protein A [Bacillus fengqiuensis]|nr:5-methylcytosine-specific restriction protein A [Bacillus fengqiuensis]
MNPKLLYKISEILVKFAKEGNVIQYGQVSKQLEKLSPPIVIPPLKLNEPLGAISEMCIERGLPPLSAIVVNQDTYLPGDGFFTYVAGLLGYPDLKGNEWEVFYEEQREAVFQIQNWDGFLHSFYEKPAPKQKGNTWIFQGNPLYFRIDDYVQEHDRWLWSLNQEHYKDRIQNGDTVYIWRSDGGQKGTGGIIARGKITAQPKETEDASDYWITEGDTEERESIPVKREQLLMHSPVTRGTLAEHSILQDLLILRMANQTNYLLSPEHGEALDKLWNHTVKKKQNAFDEKAFVNSLRDREYARQNETPYYILAAKCSEDEESLEYRVILTDRHKIVRKKRLRTTKKKQWLSAAKRRGLDLLFDYHSTVSAEEVSMVHYRPNRPQAETWDQEPSETFEKLFQERQQKYRESVVGEDITAELAQEDTFYKDGAAHTYYGTRYERDPRNRLRAIDIHGLSCVACGFNFEKVYGERGKDFIEIHHIKPVSTLNEETEINPEKDLVPVCSNCHRMMHRKRDHVLTVEELRALIRP